MRRRVEQPLPFKPQQVFRQIIDKVIGNDLASASEVFISSTTREVAAVGSIDAQWRFNAPGKITMALERCFKDYVRSYLKSN